MKERNDQEFNEEFLKIIMDSGYRTNNPDFVAELIGTLYNYMSEKTGCSTRELSPYIGEITKLVGHDHVQTLSVDDMCDWIIWYKKQGLPTPPPTDEFM
jgi:hypothetical protein